MRIAFFLLMIGCGSTQAVDDMPGPDAGGDQTVMMDAPASDTGSNMDTGALDTGNDAPANDAGSDAPSDSGIILDGGDNDGSICPPCMMGFKCCLVMKSFNYGKCYDSKCLACCM